MKKVVIIPAYNEQPRIREVIKKIISLDSSLDIVVIDDGSLDKTAHVAKEAGAVVLTHPFNMGYGITLQTGYKYALENAYDIVIQIDGDGQHDPRYIPYMIEAMLSKKVDVVIGSRFKTKTQYKASINRRIGTVIFASLVTVIIGKKITDPTSGYQVITKRVLSFLTSEAFPYDYPDADLLIILHFAGFKIMEFPMEMLQNKNKRSMHGGVLKNLYYIFKMFMSIFLVLISENIIKKKER